MKHVLVATALLLGIEQSSERDQDALEVKTLLDSGPRDECVDVLFVGDGYTRKQLARSGKYLKDVKRCMKGLFNEIPFRWYEDDFNVRAVMLESAEAGCDESRDVDVVDTALDSSFDSKQGRLLAFRDTERLKGVVKEAGGADIVFVMVNTERYGGAGTTLEGLSKEGEYGPAPTYSAMDSTSFLIAVHELGHSFAGLADEYVDEAAQRIYELPEDESEDLGAPNVTLSGHFDSTSFETLKNTVKWGHLLELRGAEKYEWIHEGGYFRDSGVFRAWPICRMRKIEDPFCPVCCEEMAKSIVQTCGRKWDGDEYHDDHPFKKEVWSKRRR